MEEAAEAREYVRILRRCGFSMTEIAGKIGLSRVSVTLRGIPVVAIVGGYF